MVKTTGGPALCAKVVSPALTSGAVSLLQEHLTTEEKELWVSLGPNWTSHWFVCLCMCVWISVLQCVRVSCCSNKPSRTISPSSQLSVTVPPYTPVFLDGWQPQTFDSTGQPLEDPIESQHKQDAVMESSAAQTLQVRARQTAEGAGEAADEV